MACPSHDLRVPATSTPRGDVASWRATMLSDDALLWTALRGEGQSMLAADTTFQRLHLAANSVLPCVDVGAFASHTAHALPVVGSSGLLEDIAHCFTLSDAVRGPLNSELCKVAAIMAAAAAASAAVVPAAAAAAAAALGLAVAGGIAIPAPTGLPLADDGLASAAAAVVAAAAVAAATIAVNVRPPAGLLLPGVDLLAEFGTACDPAAAAIAATATAAAALAATMAVGGVGVGQINVEVIVPPADLLLLGGDLLPERGCHGAECDPAAAGVATAAAVAAAAAAAVDPTAAAALAVAATGATALGGAIGHAHAQNTAGVLMSNRGGFQSSGHLFGNAAGEVQ